MIFFYILLGACVFLFLAYILATRCRKGHEGLSKLRSYAYAHRGLHGDGVPENSLKAFALAVDAGYGSELDVHLLADGNLAVIHDSTLQRTTSSLGIVEDLKVQDLQNFWLEGTDQHIPTLNEVLAIYNGRFPLIVELKPVGNNHAELCTKVAEMLDAYEGSYCIESFDPRCVAWFRKNRPDVVRGQLTENFFLSPSSKLPAIIKFVMKVQLLNFLTLPDFIAYKFKDRVNFSNFLCRKIWGAQGVTWTLKSQAEFDIAVAEDWIPIFEGFRP